MYLHREVLELTGHVFQLGEKVDHLDHNTLNNQLANLRVTTHTVNLHNNKLNKRSTSGIKGVCFDKRYRKYVVRVGSKHVGYFNIKEEAGYAYDQEKFRLTNSWKGTNQDLGLLPRRELMTDNNGTDPKLDKVVETYVKIRDRRAELSRAFKEEDKRLKEKQQTLGVFILGQLDKIGVKSVRTEFGTAYKGIDIKASCQDWNAFYTWVSENHAFDALEKRVKQTFIADYMKDNKGELPPGISVLQEYDITVRRS